jgi:uncharacterized membrane protein
MERYWVEWFGNSVAVRRSLSAVISLLVFPCLYWLCIELFQSPMVGWVAIAEIAISPFHVLYAQEAREYSLWTVTILLACAALLRAIRLQTKLSWGIYAVSLALGLYSYLFSGLVAFAHGIYVAIIERFRFTRTLTAYLLATLAGLVAFVPWIVMVITNLTVIRATTSWTRGYTSPAILLQTWGLNTSRIFIDSDFKLLYLPIVILVGYSIYFLCRQTPKRVWLFILTLIGSTGLVLIIPDLLGKGRLSTIARYLIPCYLGIEIAVAYLFTAKLTMPGSYWKKKAWQLIILLLTVSAVYSCAVDSQAVWSWNKYTAIYKPDVARIVNQAKNPLFITSDLGAIQTFGYLFKPQVKQQLVPVEQLTTPNGTYCQQEILKSFSNIFVYTVIDSISNPTSTPYRLDNNQNCKIQLVHEWQKTVEPVYHVQASLWQLKMGNSISPKS